MLTKKWTFQINVLISSSSKGNKTVPEKVATTCTEDEHKTEYQNKHYNINQKDEGT